MRKKLLYTLIIYQIIISALFSSTYDAFSKIQINPQIIALANSGVVQKYNNDAFRVNPALLNWGKRKEVNISYKQWYEGIQIASVSYSTYINDNLSFGIMIPYLNKSNIITYDEYGDSVGIYNYSLGGLKPAIAYKFKDIISIGMGASIIQQNLFGSEKYYITGNLGVFLTKNNFDVGLSISDLGYPLIDSISIITSSYKLNGGIAYNYYNNRVVGNLSYIADNELTMGIGFESFLLNTLFLRIGYLYNNKVIRKYNSLRAGVGIKIKSVVIDYSAEYDEYFGLINCLGVRWQL